MIDQKLRDKVGDAYVAAIPLVTVNVAWFILCIPLITIIPATAGLFYATNKLAHGKDAGWRTVVEGFRRYFWRSWLWGLLNVLVFAVLAGNLFFYSMNEADWTMAARVMVGVVLLLWLAVQMHTFPLLLEQEQPRLRLALRNSFVILLKRPFYTMATTLLVAALIVVSSSIIQPAWIFITASLCTYLANRTTLGAIAQMTGKPADAPLSSDPGYRVGE